MAREICGKFAASFIPRRGEYFACVLAPDHEGPCRPGGECFTHGKYIGEPNQIPRCPKWPDCIAGERILGAEGHIQEEGR